KKNAINDAMWRAIPAAMAEFDRDAEVRCVAFRGAGSEAFAAGADISEFENVRSDRGAVAEYDDLLDRVLHSIQDSLKPSLAMILVHRVLPDAELERYVDGVIETLCKNAPLAIANSKTILEQYVKSAGAPDTARMRAAIERCAKSADYIEGRRAFMEKRKPRFTGK